MTTDHKKNLVINEDVNADIKLTHFGRSRRSKSDPPGPLWPRARTFSCGPVYYTCTVLLAA